MNKFFRIIIFLGAAVAVWAGLIRLMFIHKAFLFLAIPAAIFLVLLYAWAWGLME